MSVRSLQSIARAPGEGMMLAVDDARLWGTLVCMAGTSPDSPQVSARKLHVQAPRRVLSLTNQVFDAAPGCGALIDIDAGA